jgi:uncharacterized membrane protein YfcA
MWRKVSSSLSWGTQGRVRAPCVLPFLILIVVASFLLGGREQVEAAEEEISR